jgi:hypothetical protein
VGEHTFVAVDVAKAVFQLAVSEEPGRVKLHRRLSRGELEVFFAQSPRATVVMEACGSAHHWGRRIQNSAWGDSPSVGFLPAAPPGARRTLRALPRAKAKPSQQGRRRARQQARPHRLGLEERQGIRFPGTPGPGTLTETPMI